MLTDPEAETGQSTVKVDPAGIEIAVPAGLTLMAAAQQTGIRWPNVCGGEAQCGVCVVEVVEGTETLPPPALRESQMLGRIAARPRHAGLLRLACQMQCAGTMRVIKPGVRGAPKPA